MQRAALREPLLCDSLAGIRFDSRSLQGQATTCARTPLCWLAMMRPAEQLWRAQALLMAKNPECNQKVHPHHMSQPTIQLVNEVI
ncbi:unnamed protein product [Protopolystoma xenopodis]|uniref:Uncharacterized protein n=1 Tax=Protopolystoma xenopodis TaxID=117903 RepID=A0A448X0I0_9PLAT|nr:unnamed protein product [Protopolystoma xenopodis]